MVSLFSFDDVGLRLGSTQILNKLNGQIPPEGVTCVVGNSGSGKTSLLRLLNRLEVPTTGVVRYRGEDLALVPATQVRRSIGMVFQRPALFEGTAVDNLRVGDPTLSDAEANDYLCKVGLPAEIGEREASLMSGGEAQRLCLARALTVKPQVLVLDEPTASLDAESVAVLESYLMKLARQGLPQVWVSHDPDQVDRIADHVLQIEEMQA